MTKALKVPTICLAILLSGGISVTEVYAPTDPIVELVKSAPASDEYPEADAIILLDDQKVTVNRDGSSEFVRHQVIKTITEVGKSEYANMREEYDVSFEELIVLKARTIKPDGTTIDVPSEAINEVTPWMLAFLGDVGIYANLKEKVVSFTGLETGCAVELETKKISKKSYVEGHFWEETSFQNSSPILEKSLTLIVPKDLEFNHKIFNGEIEPKIEDEDETKVYTWKVKDVPQLIWEQYESPWGDIATYLMYSSIKTWDDIGKWYSELFYPQVKSDESIKDKVAELTKGIKNRDELINRIFLYVTKDIRTLSFLQLGDVGYEPQSAVDVYKNKYGDCKDKVALLVAMLKDAGIESYPALIHRGRVTIERRTKGYYDRWVFSPATNKLCHEVPSPAQFKHLIVAVPQNGGYVWLDPSADRCKYGYLPYADQGRECLVVMPKKNVMTRTPTHPLEQNLSHAIISIRLSSDGSIKGDMVCKLDGYFDLLARVRLMGITPEREKRYFTEAASSICEKTKLKHYHLPDLKDLAAPATISLDFITPEYGVREQDLMILQLPKVPFEFANIAEQLQSVTELEKREQRLILDSQLMGKYDATVRIPKGYKVNTMPDELQIDNSVGSINLTCKQDGKTIKYSLMLVIKDKDVSPTEYALLKELYAKLLSPQNWVLILEK